MTYVLEKITSDDQQKILAVADERQRARLKASSFFSVNDDLPWAINKERGYYLMRAPWLGPNSTIPYFFFHFNGQLFNLAVYMNFDEAGDLYKPVHLIDKPSADGLKLFQFELKEAFSIHRLSGRPEMEPPFSPTFETEGK